MGKKFCFFVDLCTITDLLIHIHPVIFVSMVINYGSEDINVLRVTTTNGEFAIKQKLWMSILGTCI